MSYLDNVTWIKGWYVLLSMNQGDIGTNDMWTQINAEWYRNNTLIKTDNFNSFIEGEPKATFRIWVDQWFSKTDADRRHQSRVISYYYGMEQNAFLWWGDWSPYLTNTSQSMYSGTTFDADGAVTSCAEFTLFTIGFNLSRPSTQSGEADFRVTLRDFDIFETKLAGDVMAGVDTPIFVDTKIPNLAPTGFLSPIYTAITSLGAIIVDAFSHAGNIAWSELSSRYPWFTNFWETSGAMVVKFSSFTSFIWSYLSGFLDWLLSIIDFAIYPFTIIGSAWRYITDSLGVFHGIYWNDIIVLFIVVVFGSSLMEAFGTGDTPFIIGLIRTTWGVASTLLLWTYRLARLIIDTILGLIPF